MLICLAFIYFITFIVFPAAFFAPKFNFFNDDDIRDRWSGILVLSIFNVSDTIGRYLGDKINISISTIIVLSITRGLLIISTTLIAKNIWESDIFNIINLSLFAFSNGFLAT